MKHIPLSLLLFGACNGLSAMKIGIFLCGSCNVLSAMEVGEQYLAFYGTTKSPPKVEPSHFIDLTTSPQKTVPTPKNTDQTIIKKQKNRKEVIVKPNWNARRGKVLAKQEKLAKEEAENRKQQIAASGETPEKYFGDEW